MRKLKDKVFGGLKLPNKEHQTTINWHNFLIKKL